MSDFVAGVFAGIFVTMGIVAVSVSVLDTPEDRLRKEAVEVGAAYWCIEDHERVFSWNECEN